MKSTTLLKLQLSTIRIKRAKKEYALIRDMHFSLPEDLDQAIKDNWETDNDNIKSL